MSLRFATDEDFDQNIVEGLLRHLPTLDIQGVRDAGRAGAADSGNLAWAATQGRVFLTHDVSTVPEPARDRIRAGLPMPGVVFVPQYLGIGPAVNALLRLMEKYPDPNDWDKRMEWLRRRP